MEIPYFAVARANEQLIFSKYYPTRREATLAAIDAALDYLGKQKEK